MTTAADLIPHPRALDLSRDGTLLFLARQQPLLRRVLEVMEASEPWACDMDYDVIDVLAEFGRQITPEDYQILGLAPSEDLVKLLSMVSMTRLLMIVDRIGTDGRVDDVDFLSACREVADGEEEARRMFDVLFTRLRYLTRRRLLHRVYSPRRAHRIAQALHQISLE